MTGEEYFLDLEKRYNELIDKIENQCFKDVLSEMIGDLLVYKMPASRTHHTGPWGLLEHSVEVAETAVFIAKIGNYPVTMDYLILCGLLHDYGKTRMVGYEFPGCYQHSVIGAYEVGNSMRRHAISPDDIRYVTNIIGTHHFGRANKPDGLEYTCIENFIIHQADSLSATSWISRMEYKHKGSLYDCYGERLKFTKPYAEN